MVPGHTEYQSCFAGCDQFNRKMKDKSSPHKYQSKVFISQVLAGSDYLMTVTLMNAHHLWENVNPKNEKITNFRRFCEAVAIGLFDKDW